MSNLLRDISYALRGFTKNPGFMAAAVLSLAIGIGANTSIFTIADALLLRPLPYQNSERLVILWNRSPGLNITQDWFSTAQYFDIKNGHSGFEQLAIAIGGNFNLTGDGEPERVGAIRISSNLLPMLGAKPAMGRLFLEDEDSPGHAPTAVLTYGMWSRRYGSNAQILGKSVILNGTSYQVAGILPKNFSLPREVLPTLEGTGQAEIFVPLPLGPEAARNRGHEDYNIVGTLKSGVSVAQAQAEMNTITARLRLNFPELYPPNGGLTFGIVPLLEQVVGDARRSLYILLGAVGFVLLIVCANVANLLLSRSVARQKEIAIRAALGASRWQIARQLLTESTVLGIFGGGLGVVLAFWTLGWIRVLGQKSVPRIDAIGIDERVLLFTFGISLLSSLLFGLAPALRGARSDLHTKLKDGSRGTSGGSALWGRGNSLRRLLVITEMALSIILLIGAGLLIRSFAQLRAVSPGFSAENLLTLELTLNGRKYGDRKAVVETYRQLWERLEHSPGVVAAGAVTSLPLSEMYAWGPILVEGRVPAPEENFINADQRVVSGEYFQTMQIPLRTGRFFNEHDIETAPRVAIVDEYMAEQLWPGKDPLGKRIRFADDKPDAPWVTIVGVVGRVKQYTLDEDSRIALYLTQTQFPSRAMNVVVRSGTTAGAIAPAVKKEIREIDADLPVYNIKTMEQRVEESLVRRRFSVVLLSIFAGVALVMASIGVYGVMAYLVNQGTREIGIRIALGATQENILRLVVRSGLLLAMTGLGIGLVGAVALTHVMRSLLYGISATDPLTYVGISILLLLVCCIACYIPARRAAKIDPLVSLRCD
jgi:putative ABC transport system permease protein